MHVKKRSHAVKNEVMEQYTTEEADEDTLKQVKEYFGSSCERGSPSTHH